MKSTDRLFLLFDRTQECRPIKKPLLMSVTVAIFLTLKRSFRPQNAKQEEGLILIENFLLRDGIVSLEPNPARRQMNRVLIGLIGQLAVPCVCFEVPILLLLEER